MMEQEVDAPLMNKTDPAGSMQSDHSWLYDRALHHMNSIPGCPERQELAAMLADARVVRFDQMSSAAIFDTLSFVPESIARHANFFCPSKTPTWLELHSGHKGELLAADECDYGILLACAPDPPLRWVGYAVSLTNTGVVQESYALLHWDAHSLERIALSEAALDDLIKETRVSIPPGYLTELQLMNDLSDEMAVATLPLRIKQSAFEYSAPAIAAWLLLDSDRLNLDIQGEGRIEASLRGRSVWQEHVWRRLKREGFSRTLSGNLTWFAPLARISTNGLAKKADGNDASSGI